VLLLDMAYRLLLEFRQAFTRLDTPPFSNRRHPDSGIARAPRSEQLGLWGLHRQQHRADRAHARDLGKAPAALVGPMPGHELGINRVDLRLQLLVFGEVVMPGTLPWHSRVCQPDNATVGIRGSYDSVTLKICAKTVQLDNS